MNTTKKLLTTLLLALTTVLTALAGYDTFSYNGINYMIYYTGNGNNVVGDSAKVSINSDFSGVANIASSVTYEYTFMSGLDAEGNPIFTTRILTAPVIAITKYAFQNCNGLTGVTIPNSVTQIGERAFDGCHNLSSLNIGNSIDSIGNYAFQNCVNLSSVVLPNSVTSIPKGCFYSCYNLTSLTIPNSVTKIGPRALFQCRNLSNVTIPNSVTAIGDSTFYGCGGLENVMIGNAVTSIPRSCFYECSSLSNVNIPNSITAIGDKAFYNCSSLTSVNIPNSVTTLGNFTFQGCTELTSVMIGNAVTTIGNYTFYDCRKLTSINIPNSVISIGYCAFYRCSDLANLTIGNSVTTIGELAFYFCQSLKSVTIPDAVISILKAAFYECENLEDVTIGNSVTTIGESAFSYCRTLKNMVIPNSVTTIGHGAFFNCSSMTSVTIGNSVTTIGSSAFLGCNSLTNVEIPNSVTEMGQNIFYNCSNLRSVILSNSLTAIPSSCFEGCYRLESVVIPDQVTKIWALAFAGCRNLSSVTIPNSVTTIDNKAFYDCNSLINITCLATTPPRFIYDESFDEQCYETAILFVPVESVNAYHNAPIWERFTYIKPIIPGDVNDDDYEYVPFVREGVKWTYSIQDYQYDDDFYTNPAQGNNVIYRTLELKGDTVINGKTYKAMHKYSGDSINWENDTIPVYLREENKIVYGIIPDGKKYDDCFVFNFLLDDALYISSYSREEFVLYDFNDPIGYWNSMEDRLEWIDDIELLSTDTILIGNHLAKRYTGKLWSEFQVIEGIGAYGFNHTPVCFFFPTTAGIHDAPIFNLEKVVENGEVIYPQNYVEDRYLPLIREGVKWVNEHVIISEGDTTRYYYTYEFKGSHPVHYQYNTLYYESMYYYEGYQHELDIENDSLVAGLSENEGCVHYSRNDPLSSCINQGQVMINYNGVLLYPMFNNYLNAKNYYLDYQIEPFINDENFIEVEPVEIDGVRCSRYAYIGDDGEVKAYIIEGIGFDSRDMGDLLTPFTRKPDPDADYQEYWGLSHVIKDGKIIYKGMRYNPDLFDDPGDENDDDYEYVPFVREGVKWVYYYDNPFNVEVLGMADGIQYYSFELKGDTVIDGKSYKPVQLSYLTSTGEETTQDFVPAYLREEDKKVYAILPEGRWYPQCPVGLGLVVSSNPNYSVAADEFVLYDFNDPTSLYEEYEGFFPDYTYTDTIAVGTNHLCKRHHYVRDYGPQNEMLIIEGYGYVSGYGMPLYYFPTLITGMQVFYHLSHVIENGKIIYKGTHYIPGDVNGDGEVTIADANSVIDVVIMGGNAGHTRAPAADMNDDGEVTITDVNAIIEIIIKGN